MKINLLKRREKKFVLKILQASKKKLRWLAKHARRLIKQLAKLGKIASKRLAEQSSTTLNKQKFAKLGGRIVAVVASTIRISLKLPLAVAKFLLSKLGNIAQLLPFLKKAVGRFFQICIITPLSWLFLVLVALWAVLRPIFARFLRHAGRHKPAYAISIAGLVFAIILLLSSNVTIVPDPDPPKEQRPKILISAILSLTGAYNEQGNAMLAGYRIALNAINEQGIKFNGVFSDLELVIYDDESNPERAVSVVNQIATDPRIKVVLGPFSSALANPAAMAAKENQLTMVVPLASSAGMQQDSSALIIQISPERHLLPAVTLLLDYAAVNDRKLDKLNVVVASLPDSHSTAVANGVVAALSAAGITEPTLIDLNLPTEELAEQLSKLIKLDAVFAAGFAQGATKLIEAIEDQQINVPVLALTHCFLGKITSVSPSVTNGTLCARHWQSNSAPTGRTPLDSNQFKSAYQQRYNTLPSYHSAAAAAGVLVIADAIRRAELGGGEFPDTLATTNLRTLYGPIIFDGNGHNLSGQMLLIQIVFGDFVTVYPKHLATAEPVLPRIGFNQ